MNALAEKLRERAEAGEFMILTVSKLLEIAQEIESLEATNDMLRRGDELKRIATATEGIWEMLSMPYVLKGGDRGIDGRE